MRVRNWEDFVAVDSSGKIVERTSNHDLNASLAAALPNKRDLTIEDGPSAFQVVSGLDGTEEGGDVYAVTLAAGQTYSWAYRPTADERDRGSAFRDFRR